MKTLLLGVTLSLAAALTFALEEEDITGTWYVKAVVTDKDLPEEKRPRKVSPVTVTALDRGDLEAIFTFMRNDRCFQKKILMRKTEEPGKFSTCEPPPAPLQAESTQATLLPGSWLCPPRGGAGLSFLRGWWP
ncbi:odorant-binding protein 2a-like [Sapajus apella]|uniref:Odorant-binding protein 2a-like n=1 Tax=Sapajus apella TaxID=9515 RepID=A0A6J3HF96_SAPAP|nr:odorant-binding protein 2a-like [Sapajus apella]